MELEEPSGIWDEDTWDNLIPRLNSVRAGWQALLDKIRRDFDAEDIGSYEDNLQPMIDTLLWLVPVAEVMCARQELRVFCPIVDHYSEISLLWNDVRIGVTTRASNHYSVYYHDRRKFGLPDVTHFGEGNAEQTADAIVAFLRAFDGEEDRALAEEGMEEYAQSLAIEDVL